MALGPSCSHHDTNPQICGKPRAAPGLACLRGASWEEERCPACCGERQVRPGLLRSLGVWLRLRWRSLPESGQGRQRSLAPPALPSPRSAPCFTRGQVPPAPGPPRNDVTLCVQESTSPGPATQAVLPSVSTHRRRDRGCPQAPGAGLQSSLPGEFDPSGTASQLHCHQLGGQGRGLGFARLCNSHHDDTSPRPGCGRKGAQHGARCPLVSVLPSELHQEGAAPHHPPEVQCRVESLQPPRSNRAECPGRGRE